MKQQTSRKLAFLVTALVGLIVIVVCLVPQEMVLTRSELRLNSRLLPPIQPTEATIACTHSVVNAGRSFQSKITHRATLLELSCLQSRRRRVEMAALNCRTQVVFRVAPNGQFSTASVSRTSGSKTLDEKVLKLVGASPYRPTQLRCLQNQSHGRNRFSRAGLDAGVSHNGFQHPKYRHLTSPPPPPPHQTESSALSSLPPPESAHRSRARYSPLHP